MGKIKKDSLGDRQKSYEAVSESRLVPKIPIIIRIDGKAFHTYTRGMKKPFDNVLGYAMRETTRALCKDVHTCVFGYTQSDEITLILKLPDRIKSQEYVNRRVQKMVSLTASKATRYFNKFFRKAVEEFEEFNRKKSLELSRAIGKYGINSYEVIKLENEVDLDSEKLYKTYIKRLGDAEFDSRAFNIPEWDCINNIIWRQQDAIRNSVEAVGHVYFSDKELNKVKCEQIKEKLINEKGIDWENDFTSYQKYGACCYKSIEEKKIGDKTVFRNSWHIDENEGIIIQGSRGWFSTITGLSED